MPVEYVLSIFPTKSKYRLKKSLNFVFKTAVKKIIFL